MIEHSFIQGYYSVGNEIFPNKLHAVRRAMETNTTVTWHYFDDVFNNVDKSNLGQISLDELYKQRALQLRDSYDYLVLYYSGGADSWNILDTFLKNNIRLDCVAVFRPVQAANNGIYTPNAIDDSGHNHLSEWDFIIKPDLEWLSNHHPEIHIEIIDWSSSLSTSINRFDSLIDVTNTQCSIATTLKSHSRCQYEDAKITAGKTVGKIFGVEKPKIVEKDGNCYFCFLDITCISVNSPDNPNGLEYFYISPKFPLLTVEQSFRIYSCYKNDPLSRFNIKAWSLRVDQVRNWTERDYHMSLTNREAHERKILYPGWDMKKFQANKSMPNPSLPPGIRDWERPLIRLHEFREASKKWSHHWESAIGNRIDNAFLFDIGSRLKGIYSKWHLLCKSQ